MSEVNKKETGRSPALTGRRHALAHILYNKVLKEIIYPLVGDKTTYLQQLNGAGKKLLGIKFKGVYPSDKIPTLNDLAPYCICNLDSSKEAGSHWVALMKIPNQSRVLCYDSFGRDINKILPEVKISGNGRIMNSDLDSEQHILETDCGARCLAWLVVADKWGIDLAKLI